MALPNLTDQNIQDTYQRVLQTDGTTIYDGTGSVAPVVSTLQGKSGSLTLEEGSNIAITSTGTNTLSIGVTGDITTTTTHIHETVINDEGAIIPVGTPVYSKGEVGNSGKINVGIADASNPSKMPAIGITDSELAITGDDKEGTSTLIGVFNVNLHGFTGINVNDIVYVKSGGGLTTSKPTGSALIQNVGIVLKTNDEQTQIQGLQVTCIGRTNDTPNLLEGQIFFGSGSNQMYQTHISSALDNTTLNNITISNTGSFGRIEATTISASTVQVDAATIIVGNTSFSEVGEELQIKTGDNFQNFRAKEVNIGDALNGTGSVQLGRSTQGFIAVNAEPGRFSTVFRAEASVLTGDQRMGSITQKSSGSFAILLDADNSQANRSKFVVESNTAVPGIGPRLFSVSESMETRAYGHLKVDDYITTTNITASGVVHAGEINVETNITALDYNGRHITASGNISASGQLIGMIDGGTF